MTSRERVNLTLNHQPVDRAPRELWALPGIPWFHNEQFQQVLQAYPADFGGPSVRYGTSLRAEGIPCQVGRYTDEWGCGWQVGEPGVVGEVKHCPLQEWSSLDSYELPWELLDEADFSHVNRSCGESDLFMKAGSLVRPFERMQFLRGTEALMMDLAYGEKEIYQLRDRLHEFFCAEMEMWAKTDVDGVSFMDDWGSQISLLISPAMWREFYKPLYRDYCQILKGSGKKVFFHSDGFIESIYPDLIEIGVDAVNSQLFCMDIEAVAQRHGGKITFWGEIDRQNILPFGSVDDVLQAVRRVRKALDTGRGGVIAQCEWGNDTPMENVVAVFEAWME